MPLLNLVAFCLVQAGPQTQTMMLREPAPDLFAVGETRVRVLNPVGPTIGWIEAVPTWNVEHPEAAEITVEARAIYEGGHATKYYSFGKWTGSSLAGSRWSVKGQADQDGDVLTDTLRLVRKGARLQFRLTGRVVSNLKVPKLRRLYVNFWSPSGGVEAPKREEPPAVWGKIMDPPKYAQGYFPGGKGLCSPASVAMVLTYWAARTGQRSLAATVPVVSSSVYDVAYKGAGNWSFNASFAGSKNGLTAYAARLSSIEELEDWIEAGIPVICSVSWYLLHGEELKPDESGHLVVLVGFERDGSPIFNDPGDRDQVRKSYRRADFLRAWAHSKRTVYLIFPQKMMPEGAVLQVSN